MTPHNAMTVDTIALLTSHLTAHPLVKYTGRKTGANEMAQIMPLFTSFVTHHLAHFKELYNYEISPQCTKPGSKTHFFGRFRDVWLPEALRQLRAEAEHVDVESIEPTVYLYKKNQNLNSDEPCVQAIQGWEPMIKKRKRTRAEGAAASILVEMVAE